MTKNALALIDSFFDLRMNLSLIEESETDKINSEIDSFAVKNKDKISDLSEMETIVLENFIIMEKYNYLYEKPGQAKVQHEILGNQLKKIESFVENNQINDAYFFCTQADITSCYMGYSVGDVLKYGTSVRPLYEKALECNPNLSYALTNIGQWYYFAPGIAGGSKKKLYLILKKPVNVPLQIPKSILQIFFYLNFCLKKKNLNDAIHCFQKLNQFARTAIT